MRTQSPSDVSRECLAILIGVAVVAGICAAVGHYGCHHVQANVSAPEPGTPRASYCSAADVGSGWLMFALPVVLTAAGFAVVRRRRGRVGVAVAVAVLSVVNAAMILFLTPEYTI